DFRNPLSDVHKLQRWKIAKGADNFEEHGSYEVTRAMSNSPDDIAEIGFRILLSLCLFEKECEGGRGCNMPPEHDCSKDQPEKTKSRDRSHRQHPRKFKAG